MCTFAWSKAKLSLVSELGIACLEYVVQRDPCIIFWPKGNLAHGGPLKDPLDLYVWTRNYWTYVVAPECMAYKYACIQLCTLPHHDFCNMFRTYRVAAFVASGFNGEIDGDPVKHRRIAELATPKCKAMVWSNDAAKCRHVSHQSISLHKSLRSIKFQFICFFWLGTINFESCKPCQVEEHPYICSGSWIASFGGYCVT